MVHVCLIGIFVCNINSFAETILHLKYTFMLCYIYALASQISILNWYLIKCLDSWEKTPLCRRNWLQSMYQQIRPLVIAQSKKDCFCFKTMIAFCAPIAYWRLLNYVICYIKHELKVYLEIHRWRSYCMFVQPIANKNIRASSHLNSVVICI